MLLRSRIATAPCRCSRPRAEPLPFIECAFADGAHAADRVAHATPITIEIVPEHPDQSASPFISAVGVVERFFAWINRNRRLPMGFEANIASPRPFSTPLR
jgi:hypothetical protein